MEIILEIFDTFYYCFRDFNIFNVHFFCSMSTFSFHLICKYLFFRSLFPLKSRFSKNNSIYLVDPKIPFSTFVLFALTKAFLKYQAFCANTSFATSYQYFPNYLIKKTAVVAINIPSICLILTYTINMGRN